MTDGDPRAVPIDGARIRNVRRRAETLSRLLDAQFRIPGIPVRFGLDALIGLIPGVGDAIGIVLGGWFLVEAARVGAPPGVLARMAGNVAIDALAGVVPVLGDIFDVAFKANLRNARLLEAHLDQLEGRPVQPRRWTGYALGVAIILGAGLALYGAWNLVARLL
ncbi:MAG: DUF4112 domain-containing protein [Hydrocarboniphaga effusa]|nr:DUF4112 domain-containing protein [Hydrocarboniphaga effusa]